MNALLSWVIAHKMQAGVIAFFSSGVGAAVLPRLLNMIPLAWWYSGVQSFFAGVARAGRSRLGAPVWTPIEVAIEAFLGKTVDAIRAGLEAVDDAGAPDGTPPAATAPSLELQADKPPPAAVPGNEAH